MKIYLYLNKKIHIFFLPETISGSYSFDVNEEETSKLIHIEAKENNWMLFSTEDCKVSDGKSFYTDVILENGKFYIINRNNVNYLIYVTESDDRNIKTYTYDERFNLVIGDTNQTATYRCQYSKDIKLKVEKKDKNLLLTIDSGLVYLNKKSISRKVNYLKSGDELNLLGIKIIFLNRLLIVIDQSNLLDLDIAQIGIKPVNINSDNNYQDIEVKDKNLYEEKDYFSKTPRLRRLLEDKTIEITAPPSIEKDKNMPAIFTIGPMLAMAITSVVTMSTALSKVIAGTEDLKNVLSTIIISIVMIVSTILWPVLISKYSKRLKKKQDKENIEKYKKYLQEKEHELQEETKLEKAIITENVISLGQCIENLKHRKLNFWDKRIDQNDFLVARLGVGTEKLKAKVNFHEEDFVLEEDELKKETHNMIEKYKNIDNMPIGYSFSENVITAIMGNNEKCHYFTNNILFQLLTFYSYDDLKLVVFTNDSKKHYWEYIKYLKHNATNDGQFRFFASNEKNAEVVTDVLNQEISARIEQIKEDKTNLYKPHYLIIVDDLNTIKKSNLLETITELKTNIGFSIIILESSLSKLPSLCNNFINLGDTTSGILKNSYEKQEQIIFKDEINYQIDMMQVARILGNIPIETSNKDNENPGNLPEAVTFLEMMKVGKVEQLNIMNRWNTNDSTTSLKAEIGVGTDGKLMYLDLHEKAHGPHGLIAGMTGSGKSEFIITWILSLCINFSPEDVSFILIDYKGGGLAGAFENDLTGVRLPHLTGTITNLDKSEINRTLVSIDSEVKRRQKIFNEARDQLGESTMDIYKYQGFYHEGRLTEPLPHLFIVCDEFAELKAQQPDFMDNLISVARIGRSLGVHLILATQKPSGVVNDQIWSNTKFRVCLKVQDSSDSNEMLKKPDAASLKEAGRFYLQVGYDEYYALGQSGWCGAKYYPSDTIQKIVDKSVNIVDETGIVLKTIQASTNEQKKESQGEQLSAILKEIINVATATNKFAKRLWLPNISGTITVQDIEKKYNITHEKNNYDIVIGEVDAPEKQSQYPLMYNFIKDGSLDLIGTDSQENEELITTFLYNIMCNYEPNEITYYVIDYGSQNYLKYEKDPHCGGVVAPGDNEKFVNLIKLLMEELKERKKILSTYGGEYQDYVINNPGKMPILFVVMNNYDSISDGNDFLYENIGELLRDSHRYGIVYLISSSSPGSLPERFRQLIPNTLTLSLKESGDYSYVFPGKNKIEPSNIFGRGVCLDDILHEYQIAFIEKDRTKENELLLGIFDKLNTMNLEHYKKIPVLPEQVMLSDIQSKLKGLNKVPIGIEKGSLKIDTYNMTSEVGKLVLSNKIKNLKFFINSFIQELIILKHNIIVIDANNLMSDMRTNIKNYVNNEFEKSLDIINDFADKNKNTELNNIVVFIGLSKLITKLGTTDKIQDLFNKFKETNNSHIIIFDEANKIKDYSYDEWFKLIDLSQGIYIGQGVEDQTIFKISNYSKELSSQLPKNYGFYIEEGIYHIVKLIEFEKVKDDEDEE